jgi:chromosomal replication initiation ATPase DnaA
MEVRMMPKLCAPVINEAARVMGVEPAALLVPDRRQPLVRARALVVWLLRALPSRPMSYPAIGRVLGGLDHSTVINLHKQGDLPAAA